MKRVIWKRVEENPVQEIYTVSVMGLFLQPRWGIDELPGLLYWSADEGLYCARFSNGYVYKAQDVESVLRMLDGRWEFYLPEHGAKDDAITG